MDWGAIAKSIGDQFVTVAHAPVPFLAAVLLAGWVIWKLVQREYSTRLANAASTIEMLKEHLNRAEGNNALTLAATSQAVEEQVRPSEGAVHESVTLSDIASAEVVKAERKFLPEEMTISSLTQTFKDMNPVKAARISAPHIGYWMRVKGVVSGITAMSVGTGAMIRLLVGKAPVFCFFVNGERIENLTDGEEVSLIGRIDQISRDIRLDQCEIV